MSNRTIQDNRKKNEQIFRVSLTLSPKDTEWYRTTENMSTFRVNLILSSKHTKRERCKTTENVKKKKIRVNDLPLSSKHTNTKQNGARQQKI